MVVLQVQVEFNDRDWSYREWLTLRDHFLLFLLETDLVWVHHQSLRRQDPARNFIYAKGIARKKSGKIIEFSPKDNGAELEPHTTWPCLVRKRVCPTALYIWHKQRLMKCSFCLDEISFRQDYKSCQVGVVVRRRSSSPNYGNFAMG